MTVKILRVVIWGVIAVGFVRGLWVMDSGPSADTHETVGAGLCFAAALIGAVLMFCFDVRRPPYGPDGRSGG